MRKTTKGLLTITIAAAAIGGLCYIFKDQIKDSKVYKENDVDGKIKKVKTTIKSKMPKVFDREEDFVEEDELFFDDNISDEPRDYVSLKPEGSEVEANFESNSAETASEDDTAKKDDTEASEDEEEVPTIEI